METRNIANCLHFENGEYCTDSTTGHVDYQIDCDTHGKFQYTSGKCDSCTDYADKNQTKFYIDFRGKKFTMNDLRKMDDWHLYDFIEEYAREISSDYMAECEAEENL